MRWSWAFLWLAGGACLAAADAPLPEIPTGTQKQETDIQETYWHPGAIAASEAFLMGEVEEVSSDIETTPQQTWLSETCHVRVEKAFGYLDKIHGITRARLHNGQEHSPYVSVEPGWGRLKHLQKGQKILVLLHEHDGRPAFGAEAVIELTEKTRTLPEILRRTAFQPARFTAEDLAVVKLAMPALHPHLADMRASETNGTSGAGPPRTPGLILIAVLAAAGLVLFVGCHAARRWL